MDTAVAFDATVVPIGLCQFARFLTVRTEYSQSKQQRMAASPWTEHKE